MFMLVLSSSTEVHVPALTHTPDSALDVLAHAAFEESAFVLRE